MRISVVQFSLVLIFNISPNIQRFMLLMNWVLRIWSMQIFDRPKKIHESRTGCINGLTGLDSKFIPQNHLVHWYMEQKNPVYWKQVFPCENVTSRISCWMECVCSVNIVIVSNKLSYIFWPALSLGFCSVNDDGSSFQKLLFLPSTMCSSPIQKAEWPSLFSLFYSILFCFFSVSLLLFFLT